MSEEALSSSIDSRLFSSAVLCLSTTTEVPRTRIVDTIVIEAITNKGMDARCTAHEVYNSLQQELPIRYEEIAKSILRIWNNKNLEIVTGDTGNLETAEFKLSSKLASSIESESNRIKEFLQDATRELFEDKYPEIEPTRVENCLLDCLSRLMSRYGYAYAGQVAGILEAREFVPLDALKEICESVIEEHKIIEITSDRLAEAVGILFDRRDPCLNNLAFCICQRYYASRLIGLDLPVDFLSAQIYKDSTIYLDTNFVLTVALSGASRYKEFKEVLKFAPKLGIIFAVSELTLAESLTRVGDYRQLLEEGEDVVPAEILEDVEEDILQSATLTTIEAKQSPLVSRSAKRLEEMQVKLIAIKDTTLLEEGEELNELKSELHDFDKKYRKSQLIKDDNALYHDAQLYFLTRSNRKQASKSTSGWFLTEDNSIIAHGIYKKVQDEPPYSIKLITLLTTLSPFVESHSLKLEFEELFMNLVSRDILPKSYQFTADDLKMFVGFDIKAKEMPPEFIRKGIAHIKKEILKGGGLTDENRPTVLYEFQKYISTPDKNFIELQRRYEAKIQARDKALEQRDKEIRELKREHFVDKELRNRIITLLSGAFCTIILWTQYPALSGILTDMVKRPTLIAVGIQMIIISVVLDLLLPQKRRILTIVGGIAAIASIIIGLA